MPLGSSLPAGVACLLLVLGCAKEAPQEARTVEGPCADVYGGQVCTWATLDANDVVTTFGATVPLASIEGAPAEMEMAWPPAAQASLAMPAEVQAATGVQHFVINWEPHGHPPGPYMTPHFDFHFYTIPEAERLAIDCTDTTKPEVLPTGYMMEDPEVPGLGVLVGSCVPQMGMHSGSAAEAASEAPFQGSMIMGFYRGAPIFFEPMIARAALVERTALNLMIPAVEGVPAGVRFPTSFTATHDAASDSYRFAFTMP